MARSKGIRIAAGWIAVAALVLASASLAKPRPEPRTRVLEMAEATRPAFGTTCIALAEARLRAHATAVLAGALDDLAGLSAALDRGSPTSELSRLDAAASDSLVECSPALWSALAAALAVAQESDGTYDPTALPLERAWDESGTARPDPAALNRARECSGWRLLHLEPGARAVRFPRVGMALDLGGVGPGVALDRALDSLRAGGMRRARLELGEVTAAFADEGDGWGLLVPDPLEPGRVLLHLYVRQAAVATFGPRSRTLDPRSGMPVFSDASVTVVARSAARAQALARALWVMGRSDAERFATGRRDVGVLWLEPDRGSVQAWRWNFPAVTLAAGTDLRWMD